MIHENVTLICGPDCHKFTEAYQPDDKILWEPEREVVRYHGDRLDKILEKNKFFVFITQVKQFYLRGGKE